MSKDYTNYFKGRDFVHQVGFYSPDWRGFCTEHNRLFGSGPFLYTTNTFSRLVYRGREVDCTNVKFHAAYGAWGSHSVEVVTQEPSDAPTMFTEGETMERACFNHLHMFVEDLDEAREACDALGIAVVTIGWSDVTRALEKAKQVGADTTEVLAQAQKPSFMVVDMRDQMGCMVQLITPQAKRLHDAIIALGASWDGDEATLFRPLA